MGAHHQNYTERQIQTIFNMSQAMILHFALHWPQVAETNLWPFAVNHAIYIWNNIPGQEASLRMSPTEIFTGMKYQNHNHLQCLHAFGCPVYILEPQLQDAKKLPKWKQRSHFGIYLGLSKVHSSNVHLVLNPNTGHISRQCHLVFDDNFSTVCSDGEFDADVWASLVYPNLDKHVDGDDMLPTFETETPNTLQLPSIPAVPPLPLLPVIPLLPSIPELPLLPEPEPEPALSSSS